jgi:hypothetical protein
MIFIFVKLLLKFAHLSLTPSRTHNCYTFVLKSWGSTFDFATPKLFVDESDEFVEENVFSMYIDL